MFKLDSFFINIFNKKIGQDQFGNAYYESHRKDYLNNSKRFVVYNGKVEPSKVPPLWHAWLHHLSDEIPDTKIDFKWQKEYRPNLTGTRFAYKPCPNKERSEVSSDYKPWQPN